MRCLRLLRAGAAAEAEAECAALFRATGNAAAGEAAARAEYDLGRDLEVVAWPQHLHGAAAARAWSLAAAAHQRRGDREAARAAHLEALRLHRAQGDSGEAAKTLYRLFYGAWRETDYLSALRFAQ